MTVEKEDIRRRLEELEKKPGADEDDEQSQHSDDSRSKSRENLAEGAEMSTVGGQEEFYGQLQVWSKFHLSLNLL